MSIQTNYDDAIREDFYRCLSLLWDDGEKLADTIAEEIEDAGGDAEAAGYIRLVRNPDTYDPEFARHVAAAFREIKDECDTMVPETIALHVFGSTWDMDNTPGIAVTTEGDTGCDLYRVFREGVDVAI